MDAADESGVYPNPDVTAEWVDGVGRTWRRRGQRHEPLDPVRLRRLLRADAVPLAVWQAGDVTWHADPEGKATAAHDVMEGATRPRDVTASEWTDGQGGRLLLLVHSC